MEQETKTKESQHSPSSPPAETCWMVVDGGCRANGTPEAQAYGSAHFATDDGWRETIRWKSLPQAQTSNEAEYDSLIGALEWCLAAFHHRDSLPQLHIQMDSLLVVSQVQQLWRTKADGLAWRRERVVGLMGEFPAVVFERISGNQMKKILGH